MNELDSDGNTPFHLACKSVSITNCQIYKLFEYLAVSIHLIQKIALLIDSVIIKYPSSRYNQYDVIGTVHSHVLSCYMTTQ